MKNILSSLLLLPLLTPGKMKMPDKYIPLWSHDQGGVVSMIVNTDQIVSLELLTPNPDGWDDVLRAEMILSDGRKLSLTEPFDEIVERVREARR